jgi:hypothetical protein
MNLNFKSLVILNLTVMMLLVGCLQNYGRIQGNDDLTAAFSERQMLPDYTYYFCGRYNTPWAIIGIAPAYTLKDRMWTKITSSESFEDLSENIYYRDRFFARGADMLDPSGNHVGIYYSDFTSTAIKMLPENGLEIVCPYKDNQGPGDARFRGP